MVLEHVKFAYRDKMIFEKAKVKPPLHNSNPMPNEACFLYLINGTQKVVGEMEQLTLQSKEAVLMKCGNFYGDWIPGDEEEVYEAFAVHFYPEILKEIFDKEVPQFLKSVDPANRQVTLSRVQTDGLVKNYVDSMLFYFQNPELVDEDLIKLKVKELLLLLIKTENGPKIQHLVSSLFTPHQFSFREIIHANLYADISIDQLAELTGLSVSSFKREFRKLFDDSPGRYLKAKKLEHAAELIRATDKRISTIAYECGFNDLAHFSKSFQEKYDMAPTKYRREQES